MDVYHINLSAQNSSDDYIFKFCHHHQEAELIKQVLTLIIIFIGLPLTLVAIFAVYSLVQRDHVAPIYVINLLISDLIQFCCLIIWVAQPEKWSICQIIFNIYYSSLVASVCFMMCIALERYLVIAHPLWYRFRRTIKISVGISGTVWAVFLVYLLTYFFWVKIGVSYIIINIFFLLPLPLLIFSLGGTLKALPASISVPSDEKRRIVGMSVLVLLIYTLLFLPNVIWLLAGKTRQNRSFTDVSTMCLRLSPLADLVLYVFLRKGAIEKLLANKETEKTGNMQIQETETGI